MVAEIRPAAAVGATAAGPGPGTVMAARYWLTPAGEAALDRHRGGAGESDA